MNKQTALLLVGFLVGVAVLDAHVVVTLREATAGAEQTYKGFTFDLRKENDRIVAITWKRGTKEPASVTTIVP